MTSGKYEPERSVRTLPNAMDVGDASNVGRVMNLFENDLEAVRKAFATARVSDHSTKSEIKTVYDATGYILDPHGAVAYVALRRYLQENRGRKGLILKLRVPRSSTEEIAPRTITVRQPETS
jgi:threonine synthase